MHLSPYEFELCLAIVINCPHKAIQPNKLKDKRYVVSGKFSKPYFLVPDVVFAFEEVLVLSFGLSTTGV